MYQFAEFILSFLMLLNTFYLQPTMEQSMMIESEESLKTVRLDGEIERQNGSLIVKYELTNHSQQTIYVLDLIPGSAGGEEVIAHDLAYVCFEEPNTARVVRADLPLPTDRDVYMKEIPYARPVEKGKTINGQIVLQLPIKEYNPYYPLIEDEGEEREIDVSEIKLIIGYTEVRSGMIISDTTVGGEKVQMIRGAWQAPHQRFVEKKFSFQTKMKVRTDFFDRRMPQQ